MTENLDFAEFIGSMRINAWVREPGINLYVRRSWRSTSGDYHLANMAADIPGAGALTAFLNTYEPRFRFYIENIMEDRLRPFFLKRGYTYTTNDYPRCMIGPERKP